MSCMIQSHEKKNRKHMLFKNDGAFQSMQPCALCCANCFKWISDKQQDLVTIGVNGKKQQQNRQPKALNVTDTRQSFQTFPAIMACQEEKSISTFPPHRLQSLFSNITQSLSNAAQLMYNKQWTEPARCCKPICRLLF